LWGHSTDTRALTTSLAIEPARDLVQLVSMCGRYTSTAAFDELALRFGIPAVRAPGDTTSPRRPRSLAAGD